MCPAPQPSEQRATLTDARWLSPSVRLLSLSVDTPFDFAAGQWVTLAKESDGETVQRSYSIASAPDPESQVLDFAVTLVEHGPMSQLLCHLPLGSEIAVAGPHGFFTRDRADQDAPWLFVGTGTGVTPLRSMILSELRERPEGPPLTLLFGCRTPDDLLFREEFEELAKSSPRFRYEATLSRAAPDDGTHLSGYVQDHLKLLLAPADPTAQPGAQGHVFVCGLSAMVKGVRGVLKTDLKFTRQQIHTERYD